MATRFWVVIGCLLLGYWIVSKLIEKGKAAEHASRTGPAGSSQSEQSTMGADAESAENQSSARREANWYEVLEVRPDASSIEIKAAYRRLMAQYHPDKVSSLGKELRELAEAKSKELTQAYRRAMNSRGESL
ncbi:DnaJ family molecular chaperone [Burkholderia sp. Bp9142]|uniref:J domain-containing protein n=1 Tax=Burkholderia sp. Bp9142 TaxID=2184573 RepID=UPI000F5B5AE2|nr:J domain-containing protein [Burkholderia sp. Bp9142]RQR34812.1 hypothetical protein DIE22_16115 [Burkholderia sp. Bp9142]